MSFAGVTDGQTQAQWHAPKRSPDFLFPVQALSKVFRGKFLAALTLAHETLAHERIKAVTSNEVAFTVRANDQGSKRTERLPAEEFIRRFLLHILPTGIKRIRHYGALASACKGNKLAQAKQALHMSSTHLKAQESAQAFMARVAKM